MTVGSEMTNNRFQGEVSIDLQQKVLRTASEFYFDRLKWNLSKFTIEGIDVMAESEEHAQEIYNKAKEEK